MLVRFAGPRLAAADDDLVPVKLRRGGRILGGSLSWDQPQQLAAFRAREPVRRHAGADRRHGEAPGAGRARRRAHRAHLGDACRRHAAGHRASAAARASIVLFHVTADTRWSDLPLSGAFVDMLKRIVEPRRLARRRPMPAAPARVRARGGAADRVLDGFGAFGPPPATARPVAGQLYRARHRRSSARLLWPAGRTARGQYARARRSAGAARLSAAQRAPRGLSHGRAAGPARADLPRRARRCWCSTRLVVFSLAGGIRSSCAAAAGGAVARVAILRRRAARVAGGMGARAAASGAHRAAARRQVAMKSTLETRLAYVITGDAEVDDISKAGPAGPHPVPGATHRARSRRADRRRSGARRARLLPADLLADRAERAEALARGARAHRRLHEARRHRAVRHARRGRGAARARRRDPRSRHAGAAHHPVLARHSRTRAGAARPRADQDVLPAERLPRPLQFRPALGRGAAGQRARTSRRAARRAPATASPRS